MRERRAFLLIAVLMISLILLTMGLAFLGSRPALYASAQQAQLAATARALARSGLEDARVKLNKDIQFPPTPGVGQVTFTYMENMVVGAQTVGSYRVTIDSTYNYPPFSVLSITATGFAGPTGAPTASHTYVAFLDVSSTASPTFFQYINWADQ